MPYHTNCYSRQMGLLPSLPEYKQSRYYTLPQQYYHHPLSSFSITSRSPILAHHHPEMPLHLIPRRALVSPLLRRATRDSPRLFRNFRSSTKPTVQLNGRYTTAMGIAGAVALGAAAVAYVQFPLPLSPSSPLLPLPLPINDLTAIPFHFVQN